MSKRKDSLVKIFNQDAVNNIGYLYSTNGLLSSRLANSRLTEATLSIINMRDKRVLDIGCGDGTYTKELYNRAHPLRIHGIDMAEEAINIARNSSETNQSVTFSVNSAYELPCEDNSFDIVYMRGLLHHLDRPKDALREALRVSPTLLVIEPNGYNFILKVLERCSNYHIAHGEMSYSSITLNRWVEHLGCTIIDRQWVGLVPMFCPDWLAKAMKSIESSIERLPFFNVLMCAVYIFVVKKNDRER